MLLSFHMKRVQSVCLSGLMAFAFTNANKVSAQESTPAQSQTPAEARRAGDAAVDRNILVPTAETLNEGDLTFNSYELLLAGLTYGITDDLQISGTTLLPVTEDFPFVLVAAAKYRLHKGPLSIFSVQPTVAIFANDGENATLLGIQALYDRILDPEGKWVLTLAGGGYGVLGSTSGDIDLNDGTVLTMSAGISGRLGRIVKFIGELYLPAVYSNGDFEFGEEALLFNYGVRFFSHSIAVDLAFLRPIHPDADTGLVMGIPFVTFSARF
ncbi:MAG: hypothetical protein SGI86_13670 [Deltaproteobacteria bacterium]|nr:hypothetical protein [Deltaproteobacteria bacterium]